MQNLEDKNRRVVPRWRPFRIAAKLQTLDSIGTANQLEPKPEEVEHLLRDWRLNRTPFHAANVIDAAVVLNRPEIGLDAAQFIFKNFSEGTVESDLARQVLNGVAEIPLPSTPPEIGQKERRTRIAAYRRSLREQPRNPILLVDLAREYSALGQLKPAEKALLKAVKLAPSNRFVLRSASRFWLHIGKPEQAHRVLRQAPNLQKDPWLLAAEIVAAGASQRTSRWTKTAIEMVSAGRLDPRHTTELAGALGTLAYEEGRNSDVRRLFQHALIQPTENTVAQAGWISRHIPSFEVPESKLSVPLAFEARAWDAVEGRRFTEAMSLSREWLLDEPFGTRAAMLGSSVAALALGDCETALDFVRTAIVANPEDPGLLLQLIYCLACDGDLDDAERLLMQVLPIAVKRHPDAIPTPHLPIFIEADSGLIAYRRRQVEKGRTHYRRAIELARDARAQSLEAAAFLNFLREEAAVSPQTSMPWSEAEQLLKAFPATVRGFYEAFLQRSRQTHAVALKVGPIYLGHSG